MHSLGIIQNMYIKVKHKGEKVWISRNLHENNIILGWTFKIIIKIMEKWSEMTIMLKKKE